MKSNLHICTDMDFESEDDSLYYIYINHEYKFWFWGEAHMEYNEYNEIKLDDFIVYESGLREWDAGLWLEFYNEVLPPESSYLTITDNSLTYYLMHNEEQMEKIIQRKINKGEYKWHII